tara:strand:+ start:31 stop:981 length:951 start_codon:yes stop_codon:yes gene_type:complete
MNNSELSPIAIFGYDRPEHLENLLKSLIKNSESKDSTVYFFIDGIKKSTNLKRHADVHAISKKEWGFKKTKIVLRKENYGCRKNIIEGVSQVLQVHKKIIVLEDDLTVGKYFLDYMNNSLNKYASNKKIWHINSWSHPKLLYFSQRTAVSRYISPWGWGTWEDRWDKFLNSEFLNKNIISTKNEGLVKKFNVSNLYNWENVLIKHEQNQGSIWDAYWYQTIFLNNGYTIFPSKSHTQNYGFDGSGLHCGVNNEFDTKVNVNKTNIFTNKSTENMLFLSSLKMFYFKNKLFDYVNFHKEKFSSFESFLNFLKKKLYK